jgi:hypothetical protein
MKLLALLFVTTAIVAVAPAGSAVAAPIRECGNYDPGRGWTYRSVSGATPVYNLTTRNVSCRTARRFARRYRGTDTYFPKWTCREVRYYESWQVRCTASGGRVIRWHGGL